MKKIIPFLFLIFCASPVLAETYLQCEWKAEAHNAISGQYMGTKDYSKLFRIKDNQIYDSDKLLQSTFTSDKIIAIEEYINSDKAKIKNEYTINRITGSIDYFNKYEAGLLVKFIVTAKGTGSCKVIGNKPKF